MFSDSEFGLQWSEKRKWVGAVLFLLIGVRPGKELQTPMILEGQELKCTEHPLLF